MPERSKGDVSSSNATRVVKNPLLSASVTGLSFDDFPNKPQLLPAAPPVVHAPPPAPTPVLMAGILNREPKTLVTVGQPSGIDDTESLDEINLNSSSEDFNQPRAAADANANPLLEPPPLGADSLLSQAASSFTALPSVASNVFSTFSKRIYAGGSREAEPSTEPQLDIQPSYLHQAPVAAAPPAPAPFYAVPPAAVGEPVGEPPKFYAPTEVPSVNSAPPPAAAVAGSQNTYRFTARKKLYAPIPGLSDQSAAIPGLPQQSQPPPPAPVTGLIQTPPYPPAPSIQQTSASSIAAPFDITTAAPFDITTAAPATNLPEERKSGGGLFSLTNLVPTGVLQNITGLVQSATGRGNEPPVHNPTVSGGYFEPQPVPANFFGGPNPPPPAGNYFVPPTSGDFAIQPTVSGPPTAFGNSNLNSSTGNYFVPQVSGPPAGNTVPLPPQESFKPIPPPVGNYFVPDPVAAVPLPPIAAAQPIPQPSNFFVPTPTNTEETLQAVSRSDTVPLPPLGIPTPTSSASNLLTGTGDGVTAEANFIAPTSAAPPEFSTSAAVPPPIGGPIPTPLVGNFFAPTSASSEGNFFTPTAVPAAAAVPPPIGGPIPTPPAGNYFVPTSAALPEQPAANSQPISSAASYLPPSSVAPPTLAAPPAIGGFFPPSLTGAPPSVAPPSSNNQQLSGPPPVAPVATLPPPAAGQSSYRLQKGTRLYKSPLSAQETAGAYALNPPSVVGYPTAAPAAIFNPFGQATHSEPVDVALFAAPPNSEKEAEPIVAPPPPPAATSIVQPYIAPPTSEAITPQVFQTKENPPVSCSETETEKEFKPLEKQEITSNFFAPQSTHEILGEPVLTNPPIKQEEPKPLEEKPAEVIASAPPPPTFAEVPALFVPVPSESVDTAALYPPLATSTALPNPPVASGDFFSGGDGGSANLSTATTETFFNPFTHSVTTPTVQPSGQDLVPPPLGFVEPTGTTKTVDFPPPAISPLQSFFAPASEATAEDFNFFATTSQVNSNQFPDLPPQQGIAPPPLSQEAPPTAAAVAAPVTEINSFSVPPALGFDQLVSQSQQAVAEQSSTTIDSSYQNSGVNSFAGFFGNSSESNSTEAPPLVAAAASADSANFFDQVPTAAAVNAAAVNEDQRIQNFFNNPPLQDQPAGPGELKYDIVHSGLAVKQSQERSQTPVSNLVEPPSSACSELSIAQRPSIATDQSGEDLLQLHHADLPEEILKELRMATEKNAGQAPLCPPVAIIYSPVVFHWFYKRNVDTKSVWLPFSHYDSALLETSLNNDDSTLIVPVEGGRYDVNIKERIKTPVFWEGKGVEVRRCSWFYKGSDSKYIPYTEDIAALLETEYRRAAETGEWRQKILLTGGEQVVFHGPTVIVHFLPQQNADSWGASTQNTMRPRVVKRDLDDFTIAQGESQRVDHLLFMVHGIGSACDLKMRSVEEVVEDFRNIAQNLVQSHYKNSTDMGLVGRVEVLPISWHSHLHSEELGIDEKLKSITLESIPRLRNFTNDTLLDVLFYTSPKYCQKIMNTVADALNDVYLKYRSRHPEFNGGVSLAGHSLGSLILFDMLCHQEPLKESEEENKNPDQLPRKEASKQVQLPSNDLLPKQVSYTMGPAGTGQPVINYPQLIFHPKKFFALGSPIGMFVTIRGIDKLGLDFRLPTCPGFYNIFHPFDPVAYRIEALVNPDMNGIRPVLIPHHKGRKRMHLELKETMTRVGADIKQRFMDTFKTTLDSVNFLATVTKVKKEAEETLEKEVNHSSHALYPQKQLEDVDESSVATTSTKARQRTDSDSTTASDPEFIELDFPLGKLNDSKRVDYVLQEAPLELINEYIFALSSHVCYWGSEDTILFVMKEIYAGLGISTDSQVPQQSMTIERPSSRNNSLSQSMFPM
ncbi:uncharacterized protein LOC6641580 isoform X2 [Drosophila willistoni]|uniref:uncharacterized protein LOC6641580 isoform X2 n=1 Tax=Drosophila willistoni TaxID=7260 RepID=UPI000C26C1BC|nr:uncharacterized protein LOC6641580 isoform X2 [Drosophila willistoni]